MSWRKRLSKAVAARLLVVLAARGTILISGVVVSIVTAHALGPAGRGTFFWTITFAGLVSQFSNLGLQMSNTYLAAADTTLLGSLVCNSLWVSMAGGAASIPTLLIMEKLRWGPAISHPEVYIGALTAALLFFLLGSNLLLAVGRVGAFNACQITANTTVIVATVIAWVMHMGVTGFLVATTLARVAAAAIVMLALLRLCRFKLLFDWRIFKSAFRVSFKAYVITAQGFIVLRTNVFMLQALVSSREVGLYSIAAQIADVMVLLPDTMALLLFPDLVRAKDRRWQLTKNAVLLTAAIMASACIVAALTAAPVIRHVFGEAFAGAIPIFLWMLPGVLCLSLTSILSQNLAAHGFPLSIVLVWSGAVIFAPVCAWLMVRAHGGLGAAIAYSVTYAGVLASVALCTRAVISRGDSSGALEPIGVLAE